MLLSDLFKFKFGALIVGLLTMSVVLSGCTFAPLYGSGAATQTSYDLAFSSPTSRLEQIVYQELVAHFGRSSRPDATLIAVSVRSSSVSPGPRNVSLDGTVDIFYVSADTSVPNVQVYSGTRTASASYTSAGQSLANQQASNEAAERAARELAQTIRLTLLGVLASIETRGGVSALAATRQTVTDTPTLTGSMQNTTQ